MKRLFSSLAFRVSALLAVNVGLCVALGAGWLFLRDVKSWASLAYSPLGDHVQAIGDGAIAELFSAQPEARNEIAARFSREQGATFLWMTNQGRVLAGPPVVLPPAVAAELGHAGPAGPGQPAPDARAPAKGGRFLFHTSPGEYWFGLRARPSREQLEDGPLLPPTTLVIHANSTVSFLRLMGLLWWANRISLLAGVSILLWLPFVLRVSRRLHRLTAATEQIASGRLEARGGVRGADEIGRLGEAVDGMGARLQVLVDGQRRFLGDVAHELASPIARLRLAVEILETRVGPDQEPLARDIREEAELMADLVNELLVFTKANTKHSAQLRATPLAGVVDKAIRRDGKGAGSLAVRVDPSIEVLADDALLGRALGNLLRNAVRYSDPSGEIEVHARIEGQQVILSVSDRGPGVPPEALARLGEPFFRPEAARTRETGGTGLGLALVRSVAAALGGAAHFANRDGGGFVATLRLQVP